MGLDNGVPVQGNDGVVSTPLPGFGSSLACHCVLIENSRWVRFERLNHVATVLILSFSEAHRD